VIIRPRSDVHVSIADDFCQTRGDASSRFAVRTAGERHGEKVSTLNEVSPMRRDIVCCSIVLFAAGAAYAEPPARTGEVEGPARPQLHRPHEPGVLPVPESKGGGSDLRGAAAAATPAGAGANMTYHGGLILPHIAVRAVLGGPAWNNPKFAADKLTGLDAFFTGYTGSRYASSADEYTGSNGQVGSVLTYQGRSAPIATSVDGTQSNQVMTAACNEVSAGHFQLRTDGTQLIIVYSDMPRPASSNFCGWHTTSTCSGQTVEVAFLWSLDNDGGCSPQDSTTGHSNGLAALANVTAHEVHETRTDPGLTAWFDAAGNEVGDKCAWTFAHGTVPFSNGTKWKLQSEWSNTAYLAGNGYPNMSGQAGCVDGSK
jgi:hypothetical protein